MMLLLITIFLSWNTSAAAQNRVEEPVCYMRSESGQIIDLTHLCGRTVRNSNTPIVNNRLDRPLRRGRGARRAAQPGFPNSSL
jgi:hypothetical protein